MSGIIANPSTSSWMCIVLLSIEEHCIAPSLRRRLFFLSSAALLIRLMSMLSFVLKREDRPICKYQIWHPVEGRSFYPQKKPVWTPMWYPIRLSERQFIGLYGRSNYHILWFDWIKYTICCVAEESDQQRKIIGSIYCNDVQQNNPQVFSNHVPDLFQFSYLPCSY